jgi:hypothetical protein
MMEPEQQQQQQQEWTDEDGHIHNAAHEWELALADDPHQHQQQESQVAEVILPVREVDRGQLDMQYTVDWFATVLRLRLWEWWEEADAKMEAAPNFVEETPKKIRRRARRWRRWRLQVQWEKFEDALAIHDEVVRRRQLVGPEFLHITDYYDTTESD